MATVTTLMEAGRTGMLHKLFLWVTGSSAETKKTGEQAQAPEVRGYLRPHTADVLLGTEIRQKLLKQIRENSLLPKDATEKYYMQPLRHCVGLMQGVPATEKEHHAVVGGLVDLTLKTVVCALRLSRGYMLPQGGSAEEQSAQSATWNAVIFYAALCHSLPILGRLEGELVDGTLWYPGLSVPSQSYRIRFCPGLEDNTQAMATLLGMRLLPEEMVVWLGKTPAALDTLLHQIQGDKIPGCVVSQIISDAVGYAGGMAMEVWNQPIPPASLSPVVPVTSTAPVEKNFSEVKPTPAREESMALESAIDESQENVTVIPLSAAPVVRGADAQDDVAVRDVLALMGFCSSERRVLESEDIPHSGTMVVVKPREETSRSIDKQENQQNCGEQFWMWLSNSIRTGSLSVNTPDSLVHLTGGMVFIPTPEIFFAFLKKTSCSSPAISRNDIQREFEKLGRNFCRKDNSLFQCLKYEEEKRQGRHKRWSGYLIMAREIYTDGDVPGDSLYLFVSKLG